MTRYETTVVDTPFDSGPRAGTPEALYESIVLMADEMRKMNRWDFDHPIEARIDFDVFMLLTPDMIQTLADCYDIRVRVRDGE